MSKKIRTMRDLAQPTSERYVLKSGKVRHKGVYFCPWPDCCYRLHPKYGYCRGHKDGLGNYPTRKAARDAARERQQAILQQYLGGAKDSSDPDTPLSDVAAKFLASDGGRAGPVTMKWYGQLWRAWSDRYPKLAEIPVGNVTQGTVYGWLEELRDDGYAQSTINSHQTLAQRILGFAVNPLELIPSNPLADMESGTIKSTKKTREVSALTYSELWRLADAIRPEYRMIVLLCGLGGLRIGEAIALRESDIYSVGQDLVIHVQQQWNKKLDRPTAPKGNKTRKVPIVPGIATDMRKWLGNLPNKVRHGIAADQGFVITSPRGHRIRYDNYRRDWAKALDAAGLPQVGSHVLRHTCATLLVNDFDIPPHFVADILGHSDDRVTMRIYRQSHTAPKLVAAVAHVTVAEVRNVTDEIAAIASAARTLGLTSGEVIEIPDADIIELPGAKSTKSNGLAASR